MASLSTTAQIPFSRELVALQSAAIGALDAWHQVAAARGLRVAKAIPRLVKLARGLDLSGRTMRVHQKQDLYFSRYDVEDAMRGGPLLGPTDILHVFVEAGLVPKRVLRDETERTKCVHRINRHMCATRAGRVYEKPDTRKRPDGAIRKAVRARVKSLAA